MFLPLFTLGGVEGKTFRPLAYTLALAMLGSLVFALVLALSAGFCDGTTHPYVPPDNDDGQDDGDKPDDIGFLLLPDGRSLLV